MKRIIFSLILAIMGVVGVAAAPVMAWDNIEIEEKIGCGGETFLFMRPWYYGLECDGSGQIKEDNFKNTCADGSTTEGCETHLAVTVKEIIMVIAYDLAAVIGVGAAGFLIYGGFQYVMSRGDVGRAMKAKKTITSSIIGLTIAMLALVVVNTFGRIFLTGSAQQYAVNGVDSKSYFTLFEVDADKMIGSAVNFALVVTTVAAVGFAIYSGITFAISYGDPSKIERSKKSLMYSMVGVVVSMLAFAVVNFVLGGLQTSISGNENDLVAVANQVFMVVIGVAGFVSVVGIVVGGVQYMIGSGDASKIQKAKNTVLYSIVGLVVTIIAGSIISFVLNALV